MYSLATAFILFGLLFGVGIYSTPPKLHYHELKKSRWARSELSRITQGIPILKIVKFGSELKRIQGVYRDSWYIEISAEKNEAKHVHAVFRWKNLNHPNWQVSENNGRWWYPNKDRDRLTSSELQTVNLRPNGEKRRIHFARCNEKNQLCMWYQEQDETNRLGQLRTGENYQVDIEFKSSDLAVAHCIVYFTSIEGQVNWEFDDLKKSRKGKNVRLTASKLPKRNKIDSSAHSSTG